MIYSSSALSASIQTQQSHPACAVPGVGRRSIVGEAKAAKSRVHPLPTPTWAGEGAAAVQSLLPLLPCYLHHPEPAQVLMVGAVHAHPPPCPCTAWHLICCCLWGKQLSSDTVLKKQKETSGQLVPRSPSSAGLWQCPVIMWQVNITLHRNSTLSNCLGPTQRRVKGLWLPGLTAATKTRHSGYLHVGFFPPFHSLAPAPSQYCVLLSCPTLQLCTDLSLICSALRNTQIPSSGLGPTGTAGTEQTTALMMIHPHWYVLGG